MCLAGNIAAVGHWPEARRFGFAADKIEIPAPTTSLLSTFPPFLVTQISQVWEIPAWCSPPWPAGHRGC